MKKSEVWKLAFTVYAPDVIVPGFAEDSLLLYDPDQLENWYAEPVPSCDATRLSISVPDGTIVLADGPV